MSTIKRVRIGTQLYRLENRATGEPVAWAKKTFYGVDKGNGQVGNGEGWLFGRRHDEVALGDFGRTPTLAACVELAEELV